MKDNPSPLQAAFWLNQQEKRYIIIVCILLLIGMAVRWFYLKKERNEVYTPAGIEQMETADE